MLGKKKASEFDLKKIFFFEYFHKTSLRNELHTLFLPYFDTQHSICEKIFFLILFVGGSQGKKPQWFEGLTNILPSKTGAGPTVNPASSMLPARNATVAIG